MIDITIASICNIDEIIYDRYLSLMPIDTKSDISRYRQRDDRYRTLLGKVLLRNYLNQYTNFKLSDIDKTLYNRPYIKNSDIDFNISHSGKYVICAFTKYDSIGIDIEELNPNINIDEFNSVFTNNELNFIKSTDDEVETFYRFWTIKEAILKANGRGFIADPKDIIIDYPNNTATFEKRVYYTFSSVLDDYIYSLASTELKSINIKNRT